MHNTSTLLHKSPRQQDSPLAMQGSLDAAALGVALASLPSKSSGGNGGNSTVAVGRNGSHE